MMTTNATNATTGMQLRNGKIIEKYTSVGAPQGIELDGNDYVPHAHLKDFNWDWQQKVHKALSSTTDWSPQSAYDFLQYLSATSGHWCGVVWHEDTSQDSHDFGHFLMGLIDEFKDEAMAALRYPNTRAAEEWKQECFGLWHGIIRLANEILMEWNVSERMFADPANYTYAPEDVWNIPQDTGKNNTVINLVADSDSEDEDMNAAVAPGDGDADEEYDYNGQSGYSHA